MLEGLRVGGTGGKTGGKGWMLMLVWTVDGRLSEVKIFFRGIFCEFSSLGRLPLYVVCVGELRAMIM